MPSKFCRVHRASFGDQPCTFIKDFSKFEGHYEKWFDTYDEALMDCVMSDMGYHDQGILKIDFNRGMGVSSMEFFPYVRKDYERFSKIAYMIKKYDCLPNGQIDRTETKSVN